MILHRASNELNIGIIVIELGSKKSGLCSMLRERGKEEEKKGEKRKGKRKT
jgi:hypothetical protein